MALGRFMGAVAAALAAAFIAYVAWDLNGYVEDAGGAGLDTRSFAIPWSVTTAILISLTVIAAVSPNRRSYFSLLALGLAAVMAVALFLLVVEG